MDRRPLLLALLLLVPVLARSVAGQAVVHLKNGGRIEGAIVGEDAESIEIRTANRITLGLSKAAVARIERVDPAATLERRRATLSGGDVAGRVDLAEWCGLAGLPDAGRALLEEALAIDPADRAATRLAWRWGLSFADGRLLTADEVRARAASEREAGRRRDAAYDLLSEGRDLYLETLRSEGRDPARCRQAIERLEAALDLAPEIEWTADWLVRCWVSLGDRAAALAVVEDALARRPDDAASQETHGRLLYETGRPERALAALDRAVALDPGMVRARRGLALALLALGQDDEARARLAEARRLEGGEVLDELIGLLAFEDRPAAAGIGQRLESEHYDVQVAGDRERAEAVAAALEDVYAFLSPRLGTPATGGRPTLLKVFVFDDHDRYVAATGSRGTAGHYRSDTRSAYVEGDDGWPAVRSTLYHEAFHQMLGRRVHHAPVWFNEGFAYYYGRYLTAGADGRLAVVVDGPRLGHLAACLEEVPPGGLARVLATTSGDLHGEDFPDDRHLRSLLHFLLEGRHRPALDAYRTALLAGVGHEEAFRTTLGAVDPVALEAEWRAFYVDRVEEAGGPVAEAASGGADAVAPPGPDPARSVERIEPAAGRTDRGDRGGLSLLLGLALTVLAGATLMGVLVARQGRVGIRFRCGRCRVPLVLTVRRGFERVRCPHCGAINDASAL